MNGPAGSRPRQPVADWCKRGKHRSAPPFYQSGTRASISKENGPAMEEPISRRPVFCWEGVIFPVLPVAPVLNCCASVHQQSPSGALECAGLRFAAGAVTGDETGRENGPARVRISPARTPTGQGGQTQISAPLLLNCLASVYRGSQLGSVLIWRGAKVL